MTWAVLVTDDDDHDNDDGIASMNVKFQKIPYIYSIPSSIGLDARRPRSTRFNNRKRRATLAVFKNKEPAA